MQAPGTGLRFWFVSLRQLGRAPFQKTELVHARSPTRWEQHCPSQSLDRTALMNKHRTIAWFCLRLTSSTTPLVVTPSGVFDPVTSSKAQFQLQAILVSLQTAAPHQPTFSVLELSSSTALPRRLLHSDQAEVGGYPQVSVPLIPEKERPETPRSRSLSDHRWRAESYLLTSWSVLPAAIRKRRETQQAVFHACCPAGSRRGH
jgi:hypothetical protein